MSNTVEKQKTEAKISVETKMDGDDTIYTIKTKKGQFEVNCKGDGTLKVSSDAKTMFSAIGGIGEDDGKKAWFTDENCKTNAQAVSNILELFIKISE